MTRCPRCDDAEVHVVGVRLGCDECRSALIEEAELAASFHELDDSTTDLIARDPQPTDVRCPRCGEPMQSCTLHTHTIDLAGRFLRCARHGVWVPRDALIAGYARVVRKARQGGIEPRAGVGRAFGDWNSGSVGAAIAGIGQAFAQHAPSTLPFGRWSHAPRAQSVFVSAFRGRRLACPRCSRRDLIFAGERWVCWVCRGCFVEDVALEAMVAEMTGDDWQMPPRHGEPADQPCPACDRAMEREPLETVPIQRCHGHGVWFVDDELQQVLEHAAHPPGGVGAWLHRLFHRGA
ncbi:MAG TPA: zf-TFIIB domain-containing protein [Kofleriaceae bacterium]|nr:zf-TFIIB domain-containing protein [Kofleriaceae bacterium]